MAVETLPTATIFDQQDLQRIARQHLQSILLRADAPRLNLLIHIGHKLTDNEAITHEERFRLYTAMTMLRFDGVVVMPSALMCHRTGRVQLYEHICREVYAAINAQ